MRSWLTSSTGASRPRIHRSSRSRPSRSRSFVGSSSRKTSNRDSSSDANDVRAASPPDSDGGRLVEQPRVEPEIRPGLADTRVEVGGTERQPSIECVGVPVVGAGVSRPPSAPVAASSSICAASTPVRRAEEAPHRFGGGTFRLLRAAVRRWPHRGWPPPSPCRAPTDPLSAPSSVDLPTPLGPTRPTR